MLYLDEYEELEEAEKIAAENELGLWRPDISSILGLAADEEYEEVTEDSLTGKIIDMQDASHFYVNFSKDEEKLKEISEKLSKYDSKEHQNLVHPIKPGTVCAVKFEEDKTWYRGKIVKAIHNKTETDHIYEVYFIDYGNMNDVSIKRIKKLDNDLVKYPPLANRCSLAYIKVPKIDKTFGPEAADYFKEMLWAKECLISIYDEDDVAYKVVINIGKEFKPNESINAYLINEGLASIANSDSLPEELAGWKEFEQDAKDEQLNIWEIGGGGLDDADF